MKKKVITGVVLSVLLLGLLGVSACDSMGGEDTVSRQTYEVGRGDLEITITGNGKIASSRDASLNFGSGGRVADVPVVEGDTVSSGDVLAVLDTVTLELALAQAQVGVAQAEAAMTQATMAERTAKLNLENTHESEQTLRLALLNAQINLYTANSSLEQAQDLYTWSDVKVAQANVDEAQRYLDESILKLGQYQPGNPGYETWQNTVIHAQTRLNAAESTLDAMLAGTDVGQVAIKKSQVEAAEIAVSQAWKNLEDLTENIAIQEMQVQAAGQTVTQAARALDLAQRSLDDAQRQLDEATIMAPFDGIIATITAEKGDTVVSPSMAAQTIIYMVDPGYLELVIDVDEIDIPLVKPDQEVIVTLDALPDAAYEGTVISVYPVPRVEAGVVLYNVKIGLDTSGDSRVMVGMSASADIMVEKQRNVLVVPSRAITRNEQGQTIVNVQTDGEQTEERVVIVGLDDGFRAEIVSGVDEGETVVYEIRVKSASMSMF